MNSYRFCWFVAKFLFCLWPVRVRGEAIPQTGPLIIAANHYNFLEPPLIGKTVKRRLWFLAKSEVLNWFLIGWLIKKFNWALSVSKNSLRSLRPAAELLGKGKAVVVFPTGGKPVEMKNAQNGLAWLARKTNAPIVCLGISGTQKALKKGIWRLWILRPAKIKIRIGRPFVPQGMNEQEVIQAVLDQINSLCQD